MSNIEFNAVEVENAIADPSCLVALSDAKVLKTKEDALHERLKYSPVSKLASMLARCIEIVELCDPSVSRKNKSLFSRITGADIAQQVEYQASVKELSTILDNANAQADLVKSIYQQIDELIIDLQDKVSDLAKSQAIASHIIETRLDDVQKNEQDIFRRRSANLGVMLQATELAIEQFKLNQKNALTIVHRLEEMEILVLPNWRSLILQRSLSSELTLEQSDKARVIYATVRKELLEINELLN
jgi:hypothetical protein